jgi:class 3 adenylate cyclase
MARLSASARAKLPDTAFAYIDAKGVRRLPINDASHVRNALSRFNQVSFDDEAARDRARLRLLRAAQRHSVVPIGFISAQLQPQRRLPKGRVTFVLTDIESSSGLLDQLGDGYAAVASSVRRIMRREIRRAGGHEIDARGDEFFGVFVEAPAALAAAIAIRQSLADGPWPDGVAVRVRTGLHTGRPALTETGYVGLAVHATARIGYCAHGGQILLSASTRDALLESLGDGVTLRELGRWRFPGLRDAEDLFQVDSPGHPRTFPALRAGERITS